MLFGLLRIMWCYMKSGLHDATFLDLTYFMLRCFTLPTSCQAAWCPQNLCMLFEVVVMMLSWWIFFLPHAMLPDPSYIMPNHANLLHLSHIMFPWLVLFSWCYAAWYYLLHATLLHPPDVIQRCLVFLFEYLNLSSYCYAAWSSLPHAALPDP